MLIIISYDYYYNKLEQLTFYNYNIGVAAGFKGAHELPYIKISKNQ